MLATALSLVLLSSAPKLAAPEWSTVNVPADLASFYANEVARVLHQRGLEVVTARDISTMLGLERQKQLLGCSEGSASCVAELGEALGCGLILLGSVARLDDDYRGSLKVISSRDGKVVAVQAFDASGQRALADALERTAGQLADQLLPPPPSAGARSFAWVPLVAGLALAGGAVPCFFVASDAAARIPRSSESVALRLAGDGQLTQTLGWVFAGTSAAALVTAGALLLFGGPATPPVTVSLVPGTSGLSFSVGGRF